MNRGNYIYSISLESDNLLIREGKESDFVGEKRRFNKAISGQIWLKVTLENDLLERVKKDIYLKIGILFYIFPPFLPGIFDLSRSELLVSSTFTVSTAQYYITRKIRVKITRKIFPFEPQSHRIWSMLLIKIFLLICDDEENFRNKFVSTTMRCRWNNNN